MTKNTLLNECAARGKANRRVRVVAFTAIRSEYDLLFPLLCALQADDRFDLRVIVAGAHLTSLHNYSVKLIKADGFNIVAKIRNFKMSKKANSVVGRVESGAALLDGLAKALGEQQPDLLIYLGDRIEALMAGVAANYLAIPAVHIAGGDNTHPIGGDVDEQARHSTTKLSHIHLTMAKAHERRVLKLGEEAWRVKTVGNAGLDRLRCEPKIDHTKMVKALGEAINNDYLILIYHAVSSGQAVAAQEFTLCLETCLATGLEVFVGAPNSDPGYADLLAIAQQFAQHHPKIHLYNNLPRAEFVALLKGAQAIVGNSSLGLLEASYIGLPCVNVGQRQRERIAGINVQFVDAKALQVKKALAQAIHDKNYRAKVKKAKSPYGDGFMVEKAMKFLIALPSKHDLLNKRITY